MPSTVTSRGEAAIIGAIVGDSASLGTHWIYDRDAVEKAIGGSFGSGGEFIAPASTYHQQKKAGQTTMYGEGLLVMARSLTSTKNVFSESNFLELWKSAFGVCGSYSGYADHVTRSTIYNLMRIAAENEPKTSPPASVGPLRYPLYLGIKKIATELTGAALAERAAAVATELGAPQEAAWAVSAAAAWEAILHASVACDDGQSNTLGKLVPAAVAAAGSADFAERVARAVRVTQDNADAIGYFVPLARAIEAAVLGAATTPRAAIDAALPHFDAARGARIREALAAADTREDTWTVFERFGTSCGAESGASLIAFVLARYGTEGFEAAIRGNMAGDSAARACIIGAVLGALGQTPASWLARVDGPIRAETEALAASVAAPV